MATKRKMKRFLEGGEAQVGTDYTDSHSGMKEAYDADRAAEVAAANKTADPIEALNRTRGFTKSAPETGEGNYPAEVVEVKKTVEKSAKPAAVTPAQIKAAGFDNLRDYLNDKQGLTRRGSPAVEKTVTAAPTTPMAKPAKMSREESIAQIPTSGYRKSPEGEKVDSTELSRNLSAALMGQGSGLATLGKIGTEAMMAKGVANRTLAANAAKEIAERSARVATRRQAAGAREALRRDATFEGGMARGGKVSSASRRADGIAQRGKTRI